MDTHARPFSTYRFGPYYVDIPAGQLRKHGAKIRLAGQPFEILVMLLERAGQVVTREEIQQRLWSGETFVDFENSLNKAISKLRQALADSADQPTYIETLPRRGYRFTAPIDGSLSEAKPAEIPEHTPDSTAHHWYGEAFLAMTGRFDEALAEMKRAAELDPLSPIIATDLGGTLVLARRYDQAINQLKRTLELYPDYEVAQIWLARSFEQRKQYAEALSVLEDSKAPEETVSRRAERARIYAECGRQTESLRILDDVQRQASTRFVDPGFAGLIFIGLGRNNEALTQLEKDVSLHSTALTSLKTNPIYDPLRSDPRFAALLQTVHLAE